MSKKSRSKSNSAAAVVPSPAPALPETVAPRASNRNEWLILGAILFIGFILRAWYLAEIVHAPDFAAPQQDPAVLDWYARAMVTGNWAVPAGENDPLMLTTPYFRPPGHAYYMAAIYFFTHCSYLAPRVVTMLIGLASVYLMFLLGKRLFSRGVGYISAFFMATYWGLIFWEGELNDPALFVFLAICLMHVLRWWSAKMTFPRAAFAGLLVGAYALMRPNILLFGPFIAAWMLWLAWKRQQLRRIPASWAALALATFLVILPVTIRNYRDSGEIVPISSYFGENFMIGNGEDSDGVTPWTPYLQQLEGTGNWSCWVYVNVVKGVGKELGIPNYKHSDASKYFYNKTLAFIGEHKLRTLKLALRKCILFWTPIEITCNKVVQYEKEFYPPLKYLPGFALITALFLFGSGFFLVDWRRGRMLNTCSAGILPAATRTEALREGRQDACATIGAASTLEMSALIFAYVLIYFVSFIPFFVNGRARVPIIPFCILIGAYGLFRTWQYIQSRQYKVAGACVGVFIALWGLASIHIIRFEPTEKTWSYKPASSDEIAPVYAPDHSRWYYQRAESYLRQGKVQEAIEASRPMLDMPETAGYMDHRVGRAFAEQGYLDDALAHFKAAIAKHPTEYYIRDDMARALEKANRTDEAIAIYRDGIKLHPDDVLAHTNLGYLLLKQDKFDEAKAEFEEALRYKPDFVQARVNLADLLAGLDQYAEAAAHLAKVVELEPNEQNYHYLLAVQLANANRADDAIAQYRTAIQMNPDDARSHNNLGLLLANRRQYDEASKQYQEALRVVPDFALVYANLGNMLADQGKLDDGIKTYENGLAVNPGDPGLHNGLGYLYAQKGEAFADKALEQYREALRLEPRYSRAYNNIGKLMERRGAFDEAIQAYQNALKAVPRDKGAYFNLGDLYSSQNRFDEAIQCYTQAMRNDPANADIPNNLANAFAKKGNIEEAIKYYNQAIQVNPKYVNAYCNLGLLSAFQNKREDAQKYFKKALEIDPKNEIARKKLSEF